MSGEDQRTSNFSYLKMLSYRIHQYPQKLDMEPFKWQGYEKPPEVPWEFPSECDSSYDSNDSLPPGGYVKPSKFYKDAKPKGRNAIEEREREGKYREGQEDKGSDTILDSGQRSMKNSSGKPDSRELEGQGPSWESKEPTKAVLRTTRDKDGVLRFGRGRGRKLIGHL